MAASCSVYQHVGGGKGTYLSTVRSLRQRTTCQVPVAGTPPPDQLEPAYRIAHPPDDAVVGGPGSRSVTVPGGHGAVARNPTLLLCLPTAAVDLDVQVMS